MSPGDPLELVRERVRKAARFRCSYCLSPQQFVMSKLEIEHVIPRVRNGSDDESNLWLSCGLCNRYKGSQATTDDPVSGTSVQIYNPRTQEWSDHFKWTADGTRIEGLTPVGRATVAALRLNNEIAVEVRRNWVLGGWQFLQIMSEFFD